MGKWRLVPAEMTLEMCCVIAGGIDGNDSADEIYSNVLTFAPSPLEDGELVEELARAIFKAECAVHGLHAPDMERRFKVAISEYRAEARAALTFLTGDER